MHPCLLDSEDLAALDEPRAFALDRCYHEVASSWLSRLDALVVGPGLGRDEAVLQVAERLVRRAALRATRLARR